MKVRLSILAGIAIFGAALPMAAHAQDEYRALERDDAERTMAEFASCVVSSGERRREAERFLRLVPSDPGYSAAGMSLATSRCVPRTLPGRTQMRFRPDLFRAALFSALYQRDFGRSPAPDLSAVPALVVASEFDGPETGIPETIFFSRSVGDCSARADTAGVHALLVTRVNSRAERPALQRLMPVLANCLPAGQQLRFSRSMLRGFLAEGLYKLRVAAAYTPRVSMPDPQGADR